MDRFPPLNALLAFDAAMRTNSFTAAARELCVTPGAVGQQVQKLESWLGVALFVRRIRQIAPTGEALDYWKRIRPALAQIREASASLKASRSRSVWLSMPPSFAAKWFTRRMAQFLTLHPDVELHLDSSPLPVDFDSERLDLAIRYFDGKDPALDATRIFGDEARLYCSTDYRTRLKLVQPDDLVRATLLHSTLQPHWGRWLRRFSGLDEGRIAAIPALHFDQALLAIDAARRGQGVVMTSPLVTEEEVAEGTLIEPFPGRLPLDTGYYVVHPKGTPLRPMAGAFKDWLKMLGEAGAA